MTTALKEQKVLDAAHAYAAACAKFNRGQRFRGTVNFNALVEKRRALHLAAEALQHDAKLDLPECPLRFEGAKA